MTAPISGAQPQPPAPAVHAPSSANAATAGAVASANSGGEPTTSTKIGSMEDLKKKAPKLYQKMLEGIAMSICNEMKEHQDRIKELQRKGNAQA